MPELRVSAVPNAYTRSNPDPPSTASLLPVLCIAVAAAIVHIATNGRYGFHRDELQFLSDARHLDWGFVAYPPLTPFIERISLGLFGLSLIGLRMFSVIGQAIAIVVSGLMARDLGGSRLAQVATAFAVALSPLPIFEATEFQYTSFAFLWWVLIAWFTIRLLKTENPPWWLAIGAAIGLGLMTKYAIVFFIAGILVGMASSPARRYFASKWFWAGVAIALVIFSPNILWLVRHNFISYTFLQHIHTRDVGEGRADGYLVNQFLVCANLFAVPVWLIGLYAYLRNSRYRMVAFMYLVPLLMFWINKGRFYYVAESYPMLIAMGAVTCENWLLRIPRWAQITIETAFFAGVFICGAYFFAGWVPLASSGPLRDFALKHSEDLREEIGWNETVKAIAGVRDSIPADQQANVGILVGNYGEQGAIELFGPAYHLPPPISMTNSAWLRGYPTPQPTTLIVIGSSLEWADRNFTGCHVVARIAYSSGVKNEESEYHTDILLCGPPRQPWSVFWKDHERFG
ncbi:MAG: glycosyltransferase family 39 protein [Terracidiphilus sp.]